MTEMQIFQNPLFGEVRTVKLPEDQVGGANVLGYCAPKNAITNHVDDEDKTTAPIQCTGSNYKTNVVIINESGHYSLILS